MSSILPDLLFYLFSTLALTGSVLVLFNHNPMHCAVSLVVSVLSIALLYFLLSAHFIAAAQMIIYAGAIVVLFIFVIMLLNLSEEELGKFRFGLFKVVGIFVAVATLLSVAPQIRTSGGEVPPAPAAAPAAAYGSTPEVGKLLFGEFLLAFELTGVLILAAMVAGVVLAKKDLTPKKFYSPLDWFLGFFR